MEPTVIFSEVDRHRTVRHHCLGTEEMILVRSDVSPFDLEVSSMSQEDSHFRPHTILTVSQSGDYYLPGTTPGMDLIFQIKEPFDPNSHLFLSIGHK